MFEIVREFVNMIANTFFSLIPLFRQLVDFRNAAIATILGVPVILLAIYADFKLIKKFIKLFR